MPNRISIGLLEDGVFTRGDREITYDVQTVTSSDSPARNNGNHDLGHEPDEPLDFEYVEPAEARLIRLTGPLILIPVRASDPLIAAGAERPPAVLGRRAVSGEEYSSDVGGHPSVIECGLQLVDRVRTERISHLGTVECNPHDSDLRRAVVGDVGEVEPRNRIPSDWVEDLRYHEPIL